MSAQNARSPGFEPPTDITIPEPGSQTARRVLSMSLRRVLKEFLSIRPRLAVRPEVRAQVRRVMERVTGYARTDPGAVASLVRYPTISCLVRCLRPARTGQAAPGSADAILAELTATVCLDLAVAGALDEPIRCDTFPRRLESLPGRMVLEVPKGTLGLIFENHQVTLEAPEGRGAVVPLNGEAAPQLSRPFHPIDSSTVLAVVDNNPLSMFEAHPDKDGNAIDLGGHPAEEWVEVLQQAMELVETFLPELREEIRLTIQQIVPVGYHDSKHLSASYQEAIGTIYMTLHPQLMTMTEALIHEFSHNKLNALFELDPLLENAFHPLFTSPVRPDPRPLHGIVLAVHAFLPVARLYERMLEADHPLSRNEFFNTRYRQIAQGNHAGAEVVLENGLPTPIGGPVMDEFRRWDGHFGPIRDGETGPGILYVD